MDDHDLVFVNPWWRLGIPQRIEYWGLYDPGEESDDSLQPPKGGLNSGEEGSVQQQTLKIYIAILAKKKWDLPWLNQQKMEFI